jgi:hypothetical protein
MPRQCLSIAKGSHDTRRMDRFVPKRRRGGRRKGEQSFVMLGMPALREVLETSDVDAMLSKLASMQIWPHVSGFKERRSFTVMAHEFPAELHQRAVEAAERDD